MTEVLVLKTSGPSLFVVTPPRRRRRRRMGAGAGSWRVGHRRAGRAPGERRVPGGGPVEDSEDGLARGPGGPRGGGCATVTRTPTRREPGDATDSDSVTQ